MTSFNRRKKQMIGVLTFLVLTGGFAVAALAEAEQPSRLEVLYADSFVPVDLKANILDVNLVEQYLIVGEQKVLVVQEEMPKPVPTTLLLNRHGTKINLHAFKARQRVWVKGLRHPSGQIVALEIKLLKKQKRSGRHKKING